jgi:hypothetical protein
MNEKVMKIYGLVIRFVLVPIMMIVNLVANVDKDSIGLYEAKILKLNKFMDMACMLCVESKSDKLTYLYHEQIWENIMSAKKEIFLNIKPFITLPLSEYYPHTSSTTARRAARASAGLQFFQNESQIVNKKCCDL